MNAPPTHDHRFVALAVRMFWMLLGNAILLFCLLGIMLSDANGVSVVDAVFWTTVIAIVCARFVDVRYMHGTTSEGAPATFVDWQRHSLLLCLAAFVLWSLAHTFNRVL